MKRVLTLFFLSLTAISLMGQETENNQVVLLEKEFDKIDGSWSGKLSMGINSLALCFNIINESDKTICTLDVPEQGGVGIPTELVLLTDKEIEIYVPNLGVKYKGFRKSSDIIEGTFSQHGIELPLILNPGKLKANRPQTPKKPYLYRSEEVTFYNEAEGATLKGTLTYPMLEYRYAKGSIPVVVMVTGSGGQNRDEELFDHKPFLVIADYLAKCGIASLRYDDRGVGESTGPTYNMTTLNIKSDAEAAVNYLKSLNEFGKVGVLGHSEGGTIAFMLGGDNCVDFIVSLAGAAVKGIDILVDQNRVQLEQRGLNKDLANSHSTVLRAIFEDRINKVQVTDNEKYISEICAKNSIVLPTEIQSSLSNFITFGGIWLDWFLAYDPAEAIKKIKVPVMAINGDLDLQVISKSNLKVLEDNLEPNSKNLIKEYPSLNHLFQHCNYADALNYWKNEETISPEVLKDIANWINSIK